MLRSFIFTAICSLCIANPVIPQRKVLAQSLSSLSYAVDFAEAADKSQLLCLLNQGINMAFVRAYSSRNDGTFDINAVSTIQAAQAASSGIGIYMSPAPQSSKSATQQMDELYNGLKTSGVTVRSVWIQVSGPEYWSPYTDTNSDFISSLVLRAQQHSLSVGIYTNSNDWKLITNNWTGISNTASLWYYNVSGTGYNGESPANYNDFSSFAGWTSPKIKQYAQFEKICDLTVNRNVYTAGPSSKLIAE